MKTCALLFHLLIALPAAAQTAPVTAPAQASAPQPTAADTVRAVQRLFQSRRTRGALLWGGTGAAVVASNIALSNDPGLGPYGANEAVTVTGIALLYTAPLWVLGTSQLVRFSRKKERQALADFTATHRLSGKIMKRLKPALFAPPSGR